MGRRDVACFPLGVWEYQSQTEQLGELVVLQLSVSLAERAGSQQLGGTGLEVMSWPCRLLQDTYRWQRVQQRSGRESRECLALLFCWL
jgi:hypothetical protein